MNVPFLVKQYLSEDLEQGSFSKIFWYFPLKRDMAALGGIGMFFEVLYGDVDYEVYEQISKRFWDTFSENFYTFEFEQALRKSIQAFTQLLRGFGVEEGLDVNIVLFNARKEDNSYILRIVSFGESDMYVVRGGKLADISKSVPQNKTLRDIKFLEVDLEESDILLLGNKTLLHNAFESDIIALDSMDAVLQSMSQFKDNLFGNKKVFLVAALDSDSAKEKESVDEEDSATSPLAGVLGGVSAFFGKTATSVKDLTSKFQTRFGKKDSVEMDALEQLTEATQKLPEGMPLATEMSQPQLPKRDGQQLRQDDSVPLIKPPADVENESVDDELPVGSASKQENESILEPVAPVTSQPKEAEEITKPIGKGMPMMPPEVQDRPELIIASEQQTEEKIAEITSPQEPKGVEESSPETETKEVPIIMPTPPQKEDDGIEALPSYPSDIDIEPELEVPAATISEKKPLIQTPSIPEVDDEPPTMNTPRADEFRPYSTTVIPQKPAGSAAADFRNRRSPTYKLAGGLLAKVMPFLSGAKQKVSELLSKVTGGRFKVGKIFVGQSPKDKKVMYIGIGIFILVVFGLVLYIRGQFVQAGKERDALAQYDAAVNPLQSFYDTNIASITVEDPGRYLDKCFLEISTAESKIQQIPDVIKSEDSKIKREEKAGKLAQIKENCTTKYDKINGIVRVKTANLITDFRVSLGSDADPIDMAIKGGSLVVADKGRKAIYQVNPANSSIMKLEDPSGLITDPVSVGTGEDIVFACDKNSGVVYTDTQEGFRRIVGLEPGAVGECSIVKGFGKNVYVIPSTKDRVLRSLYQSNAYQQPTRYIDGLADVRDVVIDGNIYIVSGGVEKAEVWKFFSGRRDTFSLEDSIEIGNATSAYTNPSDTYNIYVYDKTKNQVIGVEKATARRHPGIGTQARTFIFENAQMFNDVRDIVVDLRDAREVYMYVLNGSTIWQVSVPRVETGE
ncbi:MAG: hypothetical protein QY314_02360 [Candidatus Dojkabacteria bacterium]|nr:MAG: hypothetical protein QY314_02360 [Candidatus Dojkabacteria bacterium]